MRGEARQKKLNRLSQKTDAFLATMELVMEPDAHEECGTCDECASPGTITPFG
jgi:hypothetical protein